MPLLGHEAGIEQDAELLRDGRAPHLEMLRKRVDGAVGLDEERIRRIPAFQLWTPARKSSNGVLSPRLCFKSSSHRLDWLLVVSDNHPQGALVNDPSASSLPSVFEDGEAYDLMVKGIPYGLDFYVALARDAKGPVLDVACGTGRILLPCLQAGVDIEGVDLFEPMLKTLRAKAAALGLSPRVHQADMSEFSVPRRFKLVMIPFNAFIHNMTQDAQIRCLQLCREHLLPCGMLAFDTFFPSLEYVSTPEKTRVLEGEMPHPETGLPMQMYDTRTIDRVAQTQHSLTELELLAADGSIATVYRSQCCSRYFYKHEMELLLRVAGFARREIYGDFDRRPLTRENDAMIVMAWN